MVLKIMLHHPEVVYFMIMRKSNAAYYHLLCNNIDNTRMSKIDL